MAISDSQADDPRDQALARLAGLDMHKALDVLGTGKINRTVLMRSLKIFDGVVFTEDVVTALLSALGATPRGGNFDIEDIAKLVRMATPSPSGFGPLRPLPPLLLTGIGGANAQRGRSRAVLDKDEARLREMFELCKSIDAEGSVGVKKRDLVQVCRNSMHVARMLCLRKSMVQQAVEEVSRDVMETVFQGLEPLDDDAIVTFQALKELYINTALTTSSLSRLEPEQDAVAHNDNADELPAEEVEEMIVAGRLQDAANAIICAQYLSTTGKSISQSRSIEGTGTEDVESEGDPLLGGLFDETHEEFDFEALSGRQSIIKEASTPLEKGMVLDEAHVREIFEQCKPRGGVVPRTKLFKAFKLSSQVASVFCLRDTIRREAIEQTTNKAIEDLFSNERALPSDDDEISLPELIHACKSSL
eukprot:TRINITY_DN9317_c0_g1_i1.p1 TRINITY_DN9317_c0_g1~~TRINITY_DN9317_c0_g1_i1.p1  ORF type:complete len:439 (+),score=95.77 TRINITY_DN9317_c0_g1_i1:66-1319(+)